MFSGWQMQSETIINYLRYDVDDQQKHTLKLKRYTKILFFFKIIYVTKMA